MTAYADRRQPAFWGLPREAAILDDMKKIPSLLSALVLLSVCAAAQKVIKDVRPDTHESWLVTDDLALVDDHKTTITVKGDSTNIAFSICNSSMTF